MLKALFIILTRLSIFPAEHEAEILPPSMNNLYENRPPNSNYH